MSIQISVPLLKKRIENKAYAFGVSSAVATLIGEFVIEQLREAAQKPLSPHSHQASF